MNDVHEMMNIFIDTPFARIVVSRHSAGYKLCNGVYCRSSPAFSSAQPTSTLKQSSAYGKCKHDSKQEVECGASSSKGEVLHLFVDLIRPSC